MSRFEDCCPKDAAMDARDSLAVALATLTDAVEQAQALLAELADEVVQQKLKRAHEYKEQQ